MQIVLGAYYGDNRVVAKTFQQHETINATIKQPFDLLKPTFILSYFKNITNRNYLYCVDYDRYYYIDSFTFISGGRMEINCHIDILKTYQSSINNMTNIHVVRNENIGKNIITDNKLPLKPTIDIKIAQIDNDILMSDVATENDYCYILAVAGRKSEGE